MKFFKKNWLQTLAVAACLVLAVITVRQNQEVRWLSAQTDILRTVLQEDREAIRQLE